MKANLDDPDFMEGMKNLTGLDEHEVEEILDRLDSDSLIELSDAVTNNDKESVENIIGSFETQLNSLFHHKDEKDEEVEQKKKKKKKKPLKPPKGYKFSIGDDVAIKSTNEDTGDDDFVSATVFDPEAPGDTIGVKIDGKAKMVDKDNVFTLQEMVMGMVGVPDLHRMQQLAGIQSQISVQPAQEPEEQPAMNPGTLEHNIDIVSRAISALDTLEEVLPDIRLADLKTIRHRLYDLNTKMNEGFKRREKKL